MKTLSFSEAIRFLGCTPNQLSDYIESGRVQFTFNKEHKYLLSLSSLKSIRRSPKIPESKPRVQPNSLMEQAKAFRTVELRREAREAGMDFDEYKEMVLG